ncbi:tRNA lysidine(34) synthetase TilS [uncultured Sphingomonas sp.]|uniref:tRNA lysidine(34) synthetase TilS n=1 Tax=uncultured Sphingomonas sp. TaxID=158754 RepID=UPI0025D1F4E2|nr:tRNA lysidine(34) synthetase TilS [uncultured Sphingomonas sp.]
MPVNQNAIDPALVTRFNRDLSALDPDCKRLGVAVSGGPDSMALLLLASTARPGDVEAATVDHRLRLESAAEARMVRELCAELAVRHETLEVEVPSAGNLQAAARAVRYEALGDWMRIRGLAAIATAHHLDDQAETLLMRLNRGSGVSGLAGVRASGLLPTEDGGRLIRPLLAWRRIELQAICAAAGIRPVEDSSNRDPRFDRVRLRQALKSSDMLDPEAVARSAAHLAEAEEALEWATHQEWLKRVRYTADRVRYRPARDTPREIRRRVLVDALLFLDDSIADDPPRGREVVHLLSVLEGGGTATLRGAVCRGGSEWQFERAPPRR